ncbi:MULTISPECIES: DUF503 domain-containing protein [Thermotoga]|jgi:hypothetical protein|uniref:YlxP-like protein n=1 Tax=Thermotoga neapolitana (strain ATCC 49049 / DSM 4359 / NBRC 107923 / NS-E) TaxID=309803 RepID=B9K7I1_THENN|nr:MULTISPECIES: DUF503 family protein [Thermotoga]MDK2786702.1 uncharacterized protein [Thermotoga sp.]HBF11425.1 DUF503 domain-containing protein [Thermotoga neapolitana]ACM22914.1 Putative uncharacterized protein [Thermotoga neapolitana DSM 4359]AJG40836.1 hypothetical protein TRQ7_05125 [Thermotoga sp. RQ7]KFZ22023.1 hypothetical protein LA10_03768 [Thermotoga neapolitana LA10]
MNIGVVNLRVRLFGVRSLKEKRGILRRLMNDLRKKYNISISEVGAHDSKNFFEIGIAMVNTDKAFIEKVFDAIIDYLELYPGMEVEEAEREVW